jgi:hypothetical protein
LSYWNKWSVFRSDNYFLAVHDSLWLLSPVYTIKVFHQKFCQSTLFTWSKFLMGIGGKCKDNIYMADFDEYVALKPGSRPHSPWSNTKSTQPSP